MYRHILIATDGSELAGKGVEHGLTLAARLQARATVLTVSEPINTGFDDALGWSAIGTSLPEFQTAREETARKVLAGASAQAGGIGVDAATLHVAERYAAEAIVETAERQGCDLIVMASHGRRALGRLLLGSQTSEVLARCGVPVLVIR
ncbi:MULTISPECIES: universal stress protein [unclassified Pseudoxanthomonas]|uniref:universal stress protein n=1 Tax=unclassified Pseudoxanthomonas TaxID=2645906 RepID=UPI0008E464AC|nr:MULTISPECIES: universal stress protein [unclassified Pseudoxanthomonas]PPJ42899.1 universal stress protein [Pseudoxanthomonas sp. KAs_5_3]SFV33600.1 Nucleotide-binding universal stress protein, UspA family [Pseudoxanthomonas sp. YR558]